MNASFPSAYVTALVGFLDDRGHHPSTRRYWTWLSKRGVTTSRLRTRIESVVLRGAFASSICPLGEVAVGGHF